MPTTSPFAYETAADFALRNAQADLFAPLVAMPDLFSEAEHGLYTALIFECRTMSQLELCKSCMQELVTERLALASACEAQRRNLSQMSRSGMSVGVGQGIEAF